ncbi:MAG TPA: hypothetical protein VFY74_07270 [Methyloceanibacter sp.]|nr:hypothetical protein [Methyloceanibacter sp.]
MKQWLLKLMLPARQADRPNFIASSLGAGADVWGTGTLTAGIVAIALIRSGVRLPALRPGWGRLPRRDARGLHAHGREDWGA